MRLLDAAAAKPRLFGVAVALVIAFGLSLGLGLTATGVFASHDDPDELHACVNPLSRVMRYVKDPAGCARYEEVVSWQGSGTQSGSATIEYRELSAAIGGGAEVSASVDCTELHPDAVLVDAGFHTNPDVEMNSRDLGPTSAASWAFSARNGFGLSSTITVSGLCELPNGATPDPTGSPITINVSPVN